MRSYKLSRTLLKLAAQKCKVKTQAQRHCKGKDDVNFAFQSRTFIENNFQTIFFLPTQSTNTHTY